MTGQDQWVRETQGRSFVLAFGSSSYGPGHQGTGIDDLSRAMDTSAGCTVSSIRTRICKHFVHCLEWGLGHSSHSVNSFFFLSFFFF